MFYDRFVTVNYNIYQISYHIYVVQMYGDKEIDDEKTEDS